MARNEKKRAKKLQKKRNERKQKLVQAARVKSGGLAVQLALAGTWPIHKALRADFGEKEEGLESLCLIRRSKDGVFAFASFLVDSYCLGVKDAFARLIPGDRYAGFEERILDNENVQHVEIAPAYVRKLCEQSNAFAKQFGFEPHSDYSKVAMIFGDINANACNKEFTFGRDGKPFYIPGPDESYAKQLQIITLVQKAGGHFTLPIEARTDRYSRFDDDDEDYYDDEFDDEFEGEDDDIDAEDDSQPVVLETSFQQHQS